MNMNKEAIAKLTPRIIRILGFNPGLMTLQGTNTYLVGNSARRVLIDTGENDKPEYIEALRTVINEENISLAHIIITHWHFDHIGGLRDVVNNFGKDISVWKFPRADDKNQPTFDSIPLQYLENKQEIKEDGVTLRVIHTPGHTTDHIALHFREEDCLFTGDCILGAGTSVFEDLYDYIRSLENLLQLNTKIMYPGHGPVIENAQFKIESYIRHRKMREEQILQVLKENKGRSLTPTSIVKSIYMDTPENLYEAAEKNVISHLEKLRKEGTVKNKNNEWILC